MDFLSNGMTAGHVTYDKQVFEIACNSLVHTCTFQEMASMDLYGYYI